ncbi:hypothetical protein [Seonamhaeicola marinus]|uniref:Uncharacterized protein n=1 Tax=Seonamhaeicola marinus TaxID=1912246 RepID=A0A5D0HFL6_9FLAO|nr:hypothetical protein [Seonamhaeicola marinus]TYA70103.1 hypothetical protein FUA24_22730 [Seonamhaeicola marinus]
MRNIILFGLLLVFLSCKKKAEMQDLEKPELQEKAFTELIVQVKSIDSLELGLHFKPRGSYNTIKRQIGQDKAYFRSSYERDQEKALDSVSKYLYSKLLNELVPHWYNTPWDFNGHTNIPNEGEIACGYFVSTTLKHLGFNLNRYKMAQQGGLNEAKTLQPKDQLKIFSNLSFKKLKNKLNAVYNDGVYFVGLDNHVGYVLLKDKEVYFLHSSYYDNKVMIELAEASPCFSSSIYVFAEVTTNKELIKKWIFNEKLIVPLS